MIEHESQAVISPVDPWMNGAAENAFKISIGTTLIYKRDPNRLLQIECQDTSLIMRVFLVPRLGEIS